MDAPDTLTDQQINQMPETLTDDQINQLSGGQPQQTPEQQKLQTGRTMSDQLRNIPGLGFIPDLGADITDIVTAGKGLFTGKNEFANGYNNPFRSEENLTQTRNQANPGGFVKNVGGEVANIASLAVPETNVMKGAGIVPAAVNTAIRGGVAGSLAGIGEQGSTPGGEDLGQIGLNAGAGALLAPLLKGLVSGKLTQKGVNRLTDQAVIKGIPTDTQTFTQAVNDHLDNIVDPSKLAPDLRQAVEDELKTRLPTSAQIGTAGTEDLPPKDLTATWMQDFRQRMDKLINWDRSNQSNAPTPLKQEAAKILRTVASDTLHQMAPGTETLDAINHLYYNAPFSKIGIPKIGYKTLPQGVSGIPGLLVNSIGAVAAEKLWKEITGKGI